MTDRRVAKAMFWAALETVGAQASAFLFFVVFAWILSPHEFGVYALGMAIVGAVNMVLFQGFGDGLIQADRLDDQATSTAFWTNMALAVGMIGLLQVIALFSLPLFHEPMLGPVIAWLSLLCIPRALISVHSALFRRTLDLRIFAIRTTVGSVTGGLLGVALALAGMGVWALVVSQFAQSVLVAIIMWRSSPWRPRFLFSVSAFQQLLHFSKHFMTASVINSCIDDLGSMLIGLNMDLSAVGYYAVALRVIRSIIILVMTPLKLVMMPALTRLAHDRQKFGAAYAEMVLMTSTVWLPVVAILGLLAPELIPTVFGARWNGAVPVIQAMSFAALTMPLWTFAGQALSALGRPDAFARQTYWQLGLYCVAFSIASRFQIVAVGWAWSALSAAMVPISLNMLRSLAGLDTRQLLLDNTRIAVAGGGLVVTTLLARAFLPGGLVWLSLGCGAGLAIYAALLNSVLLPGHVTRILVFARGAMAARGPAPKGAP